MKYADRLMVLFDHEQEKEQKKQTKLSQMVKDIKPEEVKMQKINILEQNEDWTDSDDDEQKSKSKANEKEESPDNIS